MKSLSIMSAYGQSEISFMNLKIKKLIAREIIILSCIIVIIFITYDGLKIMNNKTDNNRYIFTSEKLKLETTLDSIIKFPWNLNWEKIQPETGKVYYKHNSPNINLEYSKRNSIDSVKIFSLITKHEHKKKDIENLSNFDINSILQQLSIILLLVAYPLRGLIMILRWSIKTI
jgi:hypothetical protein